MKICRSSALYSGAPVRDVLEQLKYSPTSIDEQITLGLIYSTNQTTTVARSHSHLTNSTAQDYQIRFPLEDRVRRSIAKLAADVESRFELPHFDVHLRASDFVSFSFFSKIKSAKMIAVEVDLTAAEKEFLARPTPELLSFSRERIYAGDYGTAYQVLNSISLNVRGDCANYMMGLCTNFLSQPEESERHFRKLLASSDPLARVQGSYVLSMLYLRMHSQERQSLSIAESLLQEAYETLRENPDIEDSVFHQVFNRNGFALCLFRRGCILEALEMLEAGVALLNADKTGARALHRSVLIYNGVQCLRTLKRFKECEQKCELLLEIDPKFPEYQMEKARVMIDQGKYHDALASLQNAKSLDSFIPEIFALEAYCFLEMGQLDKASLHYREANQREPQNPTHLLDLGYCFSEMGRSKDLREVVSQLLLMKLSPLEMTAFEALRQDLEVSA